MAKTRVDLNNFDINHFPRLKVMLKMLIYLKISYVRTTYALCEFNFQHLDLQNKAVPNFISNIAKEITSLHVF